jgi:hypothetical protein
VEQFEDRSLPSSSIPLNGLTWTHMGPAPILNGQAAGNPSSTGRLNGLAVDPSDPNVMYAASATGGIWRTSDGGLTWFPSPTTQMGFSTIAMVNRAAGDTVYAIDAIGDLHRSTNGAQTFTRIVTPFAGVERLVVLPDPSSPTGATDTLFVASIFGVFRSTNGGTGWSDITGNLTAGVPVTDIALDPTNPNVAYAALGAPLGDPVNGIYRTTNALSATPSWSLLVGGSAFLPGSTPGEIKLAVSPVLRSVIFASVALRADPASGAIPLLGLFRTTDSGVNWTPVYIANPANQQTDPLNFMGTTGSDNNVIVVSPFSPTNPLQQIVYVAGFGNNNNVLITTNSGGVWTPIGIGSDGVGSYRNVHEGVVDSERRFVIATGGGVYRTVADPAPNPAQVQWESRNGNPGPTGFGAVQFNGFALHPTDPDQALGNITSLSIGLHNAVMFQDAFGVGPAAYGWQTVDAAGFDGQIGTGQVIYNPFNPNIVYRVTTASGGDTDFIRRSTDGGLTWTGLGGGINNPMPPRAYVPPLAMDPSRPNRLFSGFNKVFATDDDGGAWQDTIRVTLGGATVQIPDLPTTSVTRNGGGPTGVTTIGVGRQSGVGVGLGTALFVGTESNVARDMNGAPTENLVPGARLWVNIIPDTTPWPPQNTNWNSRSWADITPPGLAVFPLAPLVPSLTEMIHQVVIDPTSDPVAGTTIYVYTSLGRVFLGQNFTITYAVDMNMNIIGTATIDWTDITGNLPTGFLPSPRAVPMALDPRAVTGPSDDFLYVGTTNGVWRLTGLDADFSTTQPVWQQVGLFDHDQDPMTPTVPSLPPVPVVALSLNTTTGILGAATHGRGVFEIQVRGLLRGQVFEDINGNGQKEAADPSLPFTTIRVFDTMDPANPNDDVEIAVGSTDANGVYEFRSLRAGNYRIQADVPAGAFFTTEPTVYPGFTEQSSDTSADIGFFRPATARGFAFEDRNANGTRDAGEPGIPGVRVYIDRNNNGQFDTGEPSILTAADGSYAFTNLGPDVIDGNPNHAASAPHILRQVVPTGFTQTGPTGGSYSVTPTSGQTITARDFGNIRPASIAGVTFNDLNGNGVQDGGEVGEPGFTVFIDGNANDVLDPGEAFTVSGAGGAYLLASLQAGTYRIRQVEPPEWNQTTPNPADVVLGATEDRDRVNFGNFRRITISGVKYQDTNGNGQREASEPGIGGWEFHLINATTGAVVATVQSDASGNVIFDNVENLPGGGAYRIREVPQAGWAQTTPNPADFSPVSGQNVGGQLFGNFGLYTITGTKYIDLNADGQRGANERGLSGFVIFIDANGNGALDVGEPSAFTGPDGTYAIAGVGPGLHRLVEQPRRGYSQTAPIGGAHMVSSTSGTDAGGLDFGNLRRSVTVAALDAGAAPSVIVRDANTNQVVASFLAYDGAFRGGVRVAVGHFNNDTVPDIVTAPGAGGGPHVRVFNGATGEEIFGLMAYDPAFRGGAFVAVGDVNRDGFDDIITAPGAGGGPHVKVFSGANGGLLRQFMAYSTIFRGGVTVAAGDVNGDGFTDIITGAGPGGGPHVLAFSGANGGILSSFFAYATNFAGGVFVAAGDVNADGRADIITGPGIGGGPHVVAFDALSKQVLFSQLVFPTNVTQFGPYTSGARVASYDVNLDGSDDIIVSPGRGFRPRVRIIDSFTQVALGEFDAASPSFLGGIFVGGR